MNEPSHVKLAKLAKFAAAWCVFAVGLAALFMLAGAGLQSSMHDKRCKDAEPQLIDGTIYRCVVVIEDFRSRRLNK